MAHWKRHKGKVYVYSSTGDYLTKKGLYDHLDTETDSNINYWVSWYEDQFEKPKRAYSEVPFHISKLIDTYQKYLQSRKKSHKTVLSHVRMLNHFAVRFFIGVHNLESINDWPKQSPRFAEFLRNDCSESERQIQRANSALRGFWQFLQDESKVLRGAVLSLRPPIVETTSTPLERTLSPQEVLNWARQRKQDDFTLLGLIGYFFSLRTQELFALRPMDFKAGSAASGMECSKVMAKNGLFSKLVVNIHRQRTQRGELTCESSNCYSTTYQRVLAVL